jgi:hypothetical protein
MVSEACVVQYQLLFRITYCSFLSLRRDPTPRTAVILVGYDEVSVILEGGSAASTCLSSMELPQRVSNSRSPSISRSPRPVLPALAEHATWIAW